MGFDMGPGHGEGGPLLRPSQVLRRLDRVRWTGLVAAAAVVWLLTGVYSVGPAEQGVVRRFGRHVATTDPGLHYRLPWPIERVTRVPVTVVRRIELGFRTISPGPPPQYRSVPEESLMLTGDENIVVAEVIVQYRVKDAAAYLFNVREPDRAVRGASQAALRQVVGAHAIDDVLTVGKAQVQEETRELIQSILDSYDAGIQVVAVQLQDVHPPDPVVAAFKDVASAREDQVRIVNQAEAYANDVIPRARGEAQRILREAEAYKAARIARAQGDAERFRLLAQEYRKSPEVTRVRLHLETLQAVLPSVRKVIVDGGQTERLLPLLDLGPLAQGARGAAAGSGPPGSGSPATSRQGAAAGTAGAGTGGSGR